MSDKHDEHAARVNYSADELAAELAWLANPKSAFHKSYNKRLHNLYSFAFITRNNLVFDYLEARHSKLEVPDKEINIILKPCESE